MMECISLWMPHEAFDRCIADASAKFPFETGGTFLGWWADASTVVVSAVIGPGPDAEYGRHHFEPDQLWQLERIAEHYEKSGRRETYLGDWHSHPSGMDGKLSWQDRMVMRRIAKTSSARCPSPIMVIVWGKPPDFRITAWNAFLRPRKIILERLIAREIQEIGFITE